MRQAARLDTDDGGIEGQINVGMPVGGITQRHQAVQSNLAEPQHRPQLCLAGTPAAL